MELFLGILIGLFILVLLVVVHELGHAIVARRNGVVVEEFGIGFPPRAWKKKLKNGILFSLNWLPLGGFVKLQGEQESARNKGDYGAASFWVKTKIILAGVLINWLVAVLILSVLAVTGLPKVLPDQFSVQSDTKLVVDSVRLVQIIDDSPAQKAGLESGDEIVKFAGVEVDDTQQLIGLIKQNNSQTVEVIYVRDGAKQASNVELRQENPDGILGASLGQSEKIKATWSAPIVGVGTTVQFTTATLSGLGDVIAKLFSGLVMQFSSNQDTRNQASENLTKAGDSVAGPIGILGSIFPAASQAGPTQLLFLTAIISLTLAIMNTLPIPALDGGRWTIMALFRLFRKDLTKEREEKIQTVGFLILMSLIILVTITDVKKLF